jgi:hypothetical protein
MCICAVPGFSARHSLFCHKTPGGGVSISLRNHQHDLEAIIMRNKFIRSAAGLSLAFIIIVIGKYVIVAQTAISGEWKADTHAGKTRSVEDAGKLNISFSIKTERGRNQNGKSFAYDELQGLRPEQTEGGKVSFRLAREAGIIDCEGTFNAGKGSGTFRFTPANGYVEAMRSRGFDFEKFNSKGNGTVEERLFAATMIDVTTRLADDLLSANFGQLDVDDLFKAAIFKIDSRFMSEMKATGFPNLSMEDLVKSRIFKIDADYVRQINDMGLAEKDFESLVKFRIFKVTPEFLGELKAEGFTGLSSEEIVKFRIFNINADFIKKAKAENPNVTVEEMVQMKIGVHRIKITD